MRFVKKFTENKPRNELAQTCDPPRLYSQDKSFIQLVNKVKVNKALSCVDIPVIPVDIPVKH